MLKTRIPRGRAVRRFKFDPLTGGEIETLARRAPEYRLIQGALTPSAHERLRRQAEGPQ